MSYNTATPYIASYVILEKDGKIAFVLRSNTDWMNDHYGLPSGKVEQNEDYVSAAIREAKEEVGVTVTPEDLEFVHVVHRRHETFWVDIYFRAKSWEGEAYNAEPHVHSELKWLDPQQLPKNVIPAVVDALEHIKNKKPFSLHGWN